MTIKRADYGLFIGKNIQYNEPSVVSGGMNLLQESEHTTDQRRKIASGTVRDSENKQSAVGVTVSTNLTVESKEKLKRLLGVELTQLL